MKFSKNISVDKIKLIIFDVDGTLYSQSKLRWQMFLELFIHIIKNPNRYKDILILYHFRKEREKKAGFSATNLENQQYIWCARKTGVSTERVKEIVDNWIFTKPNRYLLKAVYPGVQDFFDLLQRQKILIGIYSDYKSKDKIKMMNLKADLEICSTDKEVNAFKPLPNGLNYLISILEISDRDACLFIGDREELDGECARNANLNFLLVDKKNKLSNFYPTLYKLFENSRCNSL